MFFFSMQFARCAAGIATSLFALNAIAQTPHHAAVVAETKPTARALVAQPAAIALRYVSVFALYNSYRDEKTGSWLGANETVERVGGWRVYAREAQQPDAAAPAAPAPSATPAAPAKPDPHAGHGRKP